MQIELSLKKSLEENANVYFDKSKKAKKKLENAHKKLKKLEQELAALKGKKDKELVHWEKDQEEKSKKQEKKAKAPYYHKFRWFFTSEGFLVIGGRDATTNDMIIKKYTDPEDWVFHTDMRGSPFFVIKAEGKKVGDQSMQEVADAACTFSRAWRMGMQSQQVFYVKPDQLEKGTLPKGAFLIVGKTRYLQNRINLAVGMTEDDDIMAGPVEAVKKHCKKYLELQQGNLKPGLVAKKIKAEIGGDLDDIIRALPGGNIEIKKRRR